MIQMYGVHPVQRESLIGTSLITGLSSQEREGPVRELRHSFVSIMSDKGVPIETIADLVGHASTAVTEEVYRHQLRPVITKGAETMNTIFKQQDQAKSA
jgi:integrase